MARPKGTSPIRWCKSESQWVVYIDRKKVRLGAARKDAEIKRLGLITTLETGESAPAVSTDNLSVSEALDLYATFARTRYADQRTRSRIHAAIEAACEVHATTAASAFRGRALRDVRDALISRKPALSRTYINHLTSRLKTAFTWLAAEEYVSADVLHSLRAVRALERGRGGVERPKVSPIDQATVDATLAYASPTLAAMIRVQQLTGMRPGELCVMRGQDLARRPDSAIEVPGTGRRVSALVADGKLVWLYVPSGHKNLWRGKPRIIAIGPAAQALLRPWLVEGFLFLTEKGKPFSTADYGNAIARACRRAGVPRFGPNRLRHTAATEAAERFDPATAAALLGHSPGSTIIDTYCEQSLKKAAGAAAAMG